MSNETNIIKRIITLLILPVLVGVVILCIEYEVFQPKSEIGSTQIDIEERDFCSSFLGKGYFDNDKIIDELYLSVFDKKQKGFINGHDSIQDILEEYPGTESQEKTADWNCEIYSTNESIPILKLDNQIPSKIINEGDLDGDGNEDFSIVFFHTYDSPIGYQPLYTLKKNKWQLIGGAQFHHVDGELSYEEQIVKDKKCNCILLYNFAKDVGDDGASPFDTIELR